MVRSAHMTALLQPTSLSVPGTYVQLVTMTTDRTRPYTDTRTRGASHVDCFESDVRSQGEGDRSAKATRNMLQFIPTVLLQRSE